MNLSQRIQSRLKKLNKTERGASLEAGLSDSFLRNIRRGRSFNPSFSKMEKVARVLETSVSWLVWGEGEEELKCSGSNSEGEVYADNFSNQSRSAAFCCESLYVDQASSCDSFCPPVLEKESYFWGEDYFSQELLLPPSCLFGCEEYFPSSGGYTSFKERGGIGCFERKQKHFNNPVLSKRLDFSYNPISFSGTNRGDEKLLGNYSNFHFSKENFSIPIYGGNMKESSFVFRGEALYNIVCPFPLRKKRGAYGIIISDDHMAPRYQCGEVAFIDPTRRIRKSDYVAVKVFLHMGDPYPHLLVKSFVEYTRFGLVLSQLNPLQEFYFSQAQVVSVDFIAMAGHRDIYDPSIF